MCIRRAFRLCHDYDHGIYRDYWQRVAWLALGCGHQHPIGDSEEYLDDAELGYQELIRRVKESAEPLTKYGDFLVREKKDPVAAIEQYRQALIWSPGDDATRAKLADIFLTRGVDYFNDQQFAMAEAQFAEAAKYIPDRDSPQGRMLKEHQAKLREMRVR